MGSSCRMFREERSFAAAVTKESPERAGAFKVGHMKEV